MWFLRSVSKCLNILGNAQAVMIRAATLTTYGAATMVAQLSALDPELTNAMRMIVPTLKERRVINRLLAAFFREHRVRDFNRAISEICRFYKLKRPQVDWFEYLDWG